jgi:hypothetical protein
MATYGDIKDAIAEVKDCDHHTSEFLWALRQRLQDYPRDLEIMPEGYLLFMELFCNDMALGNNLVFIDRNNKAIGLPPMILRLMARRVRAHLPEEFKERVSKLEEELRDELRAARP